jgi:hypothetical protein
MGVPAARFSFFQRVFDRLDCYFTWLNGSVHLILRENFPGTRHFQMERGVGRTSNLVGQLGIGIVSQNYRVY